eukprot:scaffold662992_cov43-Attheya_sp.AAC.2
MSLDEEAPSVDAAIPTPREDMESSVSNSIASSSSKSRPKKEGTAHTSVLGMGLPEEELMSGERWRPPTPTKDKKKASATIAGPWWSRLTNLANQEKNDEDKIVSSRNDGIRAQDALDEDTPVDYKKFDGHDESLLLDEEGDEEVGKVASKTSKRDGNAASVDRENGLFGLRTPRWGSSKKSNLLAESSSLSSPLSKHQHSSLEDQVRGECGFFFMDEEETWRNRRSSRRTSSPIDEWDDHGSSRQYMRGGEEDYLAPRSVARFQVLHKTLNSPMAQQPEEPFSEDMPVVPAPPQFARVTDFNDSSLSYTQDGRLYMRLPTDNVRLVMDPNLEAGILSVEHVHAEKKRRQTATRRQLRHPMTTIGSDDLSYILTVDEDLYRRIFKEIADSQSPCGFYFCFQEKQSSGHVNICVAVFLLMLILIILGVNTLIWPVD